MSDSDGEEMQQDYEEDEDGDIIYNEEEIRAIINSHTAFRYEIPKDSEA